MAILGARAAFVSGLLALAVITVPAFGDAQASVHSVHLTAQFADPGAAGFSRFGFSCPTPPATPDGCEGQFSGVTRETGGLSGTTVYDGRGGYGGGANHLLRWAVDETFTGVVAGCGAGTLRWRGNGFADPTQLNPKTQTFPLWGSVTIVPGSGTDGLRGITGVFQLQAQMSPTFAQTGTIAGDVRCQDPPTNDSAANKRHHPNRSHAHRHGNQLVSG